MATEWRTRDASASRVLWYVFFFLLSFFLLLILITDTLLQHHHQHPAAAATAATAAGAAAAAATTATTAGGAAAAATAATTATTTGAAGGLETHLRLESFCAFFFFSFLTNFSYSCVTSAGTITTAAATPAAGQQEGLETQHVSSQR